MLNEFVNLTGYNRRYVSYLLRTYEKKAIICDKEGKRRVFITDNKCRGGRDKRNRELRLRRRNRKRIYREDALNILIYLWKLSDFIYGKRLVPYTREVLPHSKKQSEGILSTFYTVLISLKYIVCAIVHCYIYFFL